MEKCENYNTLGTFCKSITVNLALENNQSNADNENEEEEIEDEWEWEVSKAVQMVQPNDIVVIRSDDTFNPYYLIKSLAEPSEIADEFCDDYGHTFSVGHTVVKGHYLEVHKRLKNVTLLYEDVSKVVAVSSCCIAGISPELNTIDSKKKGKTIPLFEITNYVDEILLGLVTQYMF